MLVTTKDELDPEREQATPVEVQKFLLELHPSPTRLERSIMMTSCALSSGREDGTSTAATNSSCNKQDKKKSDTSSKKQLRPWVQYLLHAMGIRLNLLVSLPLHQLEQVSQGFGVLHQLVSTAMASLGFFCYSVSGRMATNSYTSSFFCNMAQWI